MADFKEVEAAVASDEEIVDVPIFQKNGEPYLGPDGQQSTVGVLGSESKRYTSALSRLARKRGGRQRQNDDDVREFRIALASAVVMRWSGWEDAGKSVPCEPDNVKKLLSWGHVLDQVEEGIKAHADFFAKRSSP